MSSRCYFYSYRAVGTKISSWDILRYYPPRASLGFEVQQKKTLFFFLGFSRDFSKMLSCWNNLLAQSYNSMRIFTPNGFQVNAKKILSIFWKNTFLKYFIVGSFRWVRPVPMLKVADLTRNWPNVRPPSPCCKSWAIPGPVCNRPSRHSRTPTPMDLQPPAAPPPLCRPRR